MAFVSIVFSLIGGYIGDTVGRKYTILAGGLIGAAAYIAVYYLFSINSAPLIISIVFVLSSIGGALVFPASAAVVADTTSKEMRRSAFGIYRVFTNIGWAIGPILGSLIYNSGVGYIFLFASITYLLQVVIVFFFMNETSSRSHEEKSKKEIISYDGKLILFSLGTFFLTLLTSQFNVTFPTYATLQGGIPASSIGYIYAVNGTVVVLGQIPVNRILRRFNDLATMQMGSLFFAAGYFTCAFSDTVIQFMIAMFIITIGENMATPGINSVVTKISPPGKTARYNGFNSMLNATARGMGPSAGSFFLYIYAFNGIRTWASLDMFAVIAIMLFMFTKNLIGKSSKDSIVKESAI